MFIFGLRDGPSSVVPLVLLLMAVLFEAYVGEVRFLRTALRHPRDLIAGLAGVLERKLNRERRSETDRAIRGAFSAFFMLGLSLGVGWSVSWLSRNHDFGWIVEAVLLVIFLDQRAGYDKVRTVARKLETESEDQAALALKNLDGGLIPKDGHGIARAAMEAAARGLNTGAVAPVFWYLLFGFPGFFALTCMDVLNRTIGHKTPRYRAFGFTSARLNDALLYIPARLSGLFIVLAALFVPTANPAAGLRTMLRDAGKDRTLNGGWPVAAMAGSLGLALAGPRPMAGKTLDLPWIGDGEARATALDIRRALYLFAVACLINAMWVAAIAVIRLTL